MHISLNVELPNDARPDEIAAVLKQLGSLAEPYIIALGQPLRVDQFINLYSLLADRGIMLNSIIDASVSRRV